MKTHTTEESIILSDHYFYLLVFATLVGYGVITGQSHAFVMTWIIASLACIDRIRSIYFSFDEPPSKTI